MLHFLRINSLYSSAAVRRHTGTIDFGILTTNGTQNPVRRFEHLESAAVGGTIWTSKAILVGTVGVTVGFVPLITCLAIGGSRHTYTLRYMYFFRVFAACSSKQPVSSVSVSHIAYARIRRRVARAKKHGIVVKTMYPCFEYTPDGLYGSRQHFRNANVIVTRDLIRPSERNWRAPASRRVASRQFRVMWRTKETSARLATVCPWQNIYSFVYLLSNAIIFDARALRCRANFHNLLRQSWIVC